METYARGIPTYKGENGQRIGLLCETKEQCITDDDGVRLSDKLRSIRQQIDEGPDFSGLATEDYVDAAVSGLASVSYVSNAVSNLATQNYINNAVKDFVTKEELEESAGNQATQTALNNHTGNSTVHITASERASWNAKVSQNELQEAIGSKVDQPTYNSHASNTTAHVTAAERTFWNAKVDAEELEGAVESIESDITNIVNGTTKVGKASQADTATKATSDGAGNNIVSTYSTKVEVETILAGIESGETATGNAAALGGETSTAWQTKIDAKVPNTRTVNGKALSSNIALSASDVGADAKGSASSALTSAKAYTDTETASTLTDAKEYADSVGNTTLTSSKNYTDTSAAATLKSSKDYTDAEVTTLETAIGKKANQASLDSHTGNTTVHITAAERTAWNAKATTAQIQTAIDGITSGTTVAAKATDANMLDGKDSTYFATAASVANIVNGTTTVPNANNAVKVNGYEAWQLRNLDEDGTKINNYLYSQYTAETNAFHLKSSQEGISTSVDRANNAEMIGGYHAAQIMRHINHTGDENGGTNGSGIDFNSLTQLGVHQFAGNFSEVKNAPIGWYGDCNVLVIGDGTRITQIVQSEAVLCFRRNAWDGSFVAWNYANGSVVVDTDPGVGASVSYTNGTLLFVKGA